MLQIGNQLFIVPEALSPWRTMWYELYSELKCIFIEGLLVDDDHLIYFFYDFVQFSFRMGNTPEEVVEEGKGIAIKEVAIPFKFGNDRFLAYIRLHTAKLPYDYTIPNSNKILSKK